MVTHLSTNQAHDCLTSVIVPITLTALSFAPCDLFLHLMAFYNEQSKNNSKKNCKNILTVTHLSTNQARGCLTLVIIAITLYAP